MTISVRECELEQIERFRDIYRHEMNCQIIHDSIHGRSGWTREYSLFMNETLVGYGSVAICGPWRETPTLYEFFVNGPWRCRIFDFFIALQEYAGFARMETQSNDMILTNMLFTFSKNVASESILFQDQATTSYSLPNVEVRQSTPSDEEAAKDLDLDSDADWLLMMNGSIVAAGDILYHYNRPFGDIYMAVAEPFRKQGLGTILVQELKRICYAGGRVPAARCNVGNLASRKTLQRAGFVPCGHIITGDVGAS